MISVGFPQLSLLRSFFFIKTKRFFKKIKTKKFFFIPNSKFSKWVKIQWSIFFMIQIENEFFLKTLLFSLCVSQKKSMRENDKEREKWRENSSQILLDFYQRKRKLSLKDQIMIIFIWSIEEIFANMWKIHLFILILNNGISAGKYFDLSHIKDHLFEEKQDERILLK